MKNNFFLLLVFLLPCSLFAQTDYYYVSGKVVDGVTQQPMQAASVFAKNTTIGTATDATGNFTLRLPNGGYDLAITFTGYETNTKRISNADANDKNIVIELKQKEKAMEDVVVKASNEVKDGWEKYGNFFVENFMGKTGNSKQSVIKNPEALHFYFSKKRNRLKVLATDAVLIENPSLGYKISYTLDSFVHEYNTSTGIYTGSPLFTEMAPTDDTQKALWHTNRQKAYKGSMLHFMRGVYNKNLKEEGFEIQFVVKTNDVEKAITVADFYKALNYDKDDSASLVSFSPNQPDMAVIYTKAAPDEAYLAQSDDKQSGFQLSVITIAPNEAIAIEQNGYYFDQNDITISGYWAWHKIADMLPYDYIPYD